MGDKTMSGYGHAGRLAAILAGTPAAGGGQPAPQGDATRSVVSHGATADGDLIDPRLYDRPEMRQIVADRDIGGLYRALHEAGVPQRRIAELTGQSQSEVSEIVKGRRVRDVTVLERICDGLGIPRARMGLSYGESDAYGGDVTATDPPKGVSAEVLRRHLIALGAIAAVGAPTAGELLTELVTPPPVPLPDRISGVHVVQVRDLTRRLSEAAMSLGSDHPVISSATAAWADRLLDVPGTEPVEKALKMAVSELHIVAGWTAFDMALYDRAVIHYGRGLELATEAGDTYCKVLALNCAGLATVEHGQPNDGLQMLQLSGFTAWKIPQGNDRDVLGLRSRAALQACASADSATALADLECPEAADTALAKSRELWSPTRTDPGGDLDRPAACLELKRGRLDTAEPFAVASVRRWESGGQVSRTLSGIVLATIHVRAGEPSGLRLAHGAVVGASKLISVRARQRLAPLVSALDARRGSDYQQLARMARQVATTRV